MINKSGSAHWEGGIKDGKGLISTQSGALRNIPYGFNSRFEGQPGSNPEELIGAAHAACFSMALSLMLGEAGVTGVTIDTSSKISLEKQGDGFAITRAHLETTISGQGDRAQIEELAQKAKAGCPVSKLMNAEITIAITVV